MSASHKPFCEVAEPAGEASSGPRAAAAAAGAGTPCRWSQAVADEVHKLKEKYVSKPARGTPSKPVYFFRVSRDRRDPGTQVGGRDRAGLLSGQWWYTLQLEIPPQRNNGNDLC